MVRRATRNSRATAVVETAAKQSATPMATIVTVRERSARLYTSNYPLMMMSMVGKNVTTYNSVGVPTEVDQYTFGNGSAPSTATTKTLITYASLPPNITAFKQQISVQNGSGTLLAQTTNNYDETTPVAPPTGTPPPRSCSRYERC